MNKSFGVGVSVVILLALFSIVFVESLDAGDNSRVSRSFSGAVVDTDITVTISVFINSSFSHSVYVVEETVPSGFTIVNTGGATVSGRVLKWADIDDSNGVDSVDLTYVIRTSQAGTYSFSGTYGIDGMEASGNIEGSASLVVNGLPSDDDVAPVCVLGASSSHPSTYSSTFTSSFEVICSDNVGVVETVFESDFGGSMTNVSGSSWSGVLGAGSYNWRGYARDAAGNWGSISLQSFNIAKGSPYMDLTLDGGSSNVVIGVGQTVNVLAVARKEVLLYEDGVLTSSGLKSYDSEGVHNFTAVVVEDANYTADWSTRLVTVSGAPSEVGISWNQSRWLEGTTNFSQVNISNFSAKFVNSFGKIRFLNNISVSRSLNLRDNVRIGDRFIEVKSSDIPEFNSSAELTFYGVSLSSPVILKSGKTCSTCVFKSYSGGTYISEVDSFSVYSLVEGDSGSSGGGSSGGGGGGGGSSNYADVPGLETCVPNYLCSGWGECLNGSRNMVCIDQNGCEVNDVKTETCGDEVAVLSESEVQDNKTRGWLWLIAILAISGALIVLLAWFWSLKENGAAYEVGSEYGVASSSDVKTSEGSSA